MRRRRLRAEGYIATNAKSGSFVICGQGAVPPGFAHDWTDRLRLLMAEALAHGLTADELRGRRHAAVRALLPALAHTGLVSEGELLWSGWSS